MKTNGTENLRLLENGFTAWQKAEIEFRGDLCVKKAEQNEAGSFVDKFYSISEADCSQIKEAQKKYIDDVAKEFFGFLKQRYEKEEPSTKDATIQTVFWILGIFKSEPTNKVEWLPYGYIATAKHKAYDKSFNLNTPDLISIREAYLNRFTLNFRWVVASDISKAKVNPVSVMFGYEMFFKYLKAIEEEEAKALKEEDKEKAVDFDKELTENEKVVYKHIEHLKGLNAMKEKIMPDESFNRLFKDICYLVENNTLPTFNKPLAQIGVSNQSIIYTFRLIHKDLFTTKTIKPSFIEFLQSYFSQLKKIENMKTAFSKSKPKLYPF